MTQSKHRELRKKNVHHASKQLWDMVIIGGGITGAGIYRQASLDGYKVLLLEKEDFASGTSWCSSKLVHGGLRYLENYHFSLVYESITEKNHLLEYAPELVKPLPFLFPVYKNDRRPLWMIYAGTFLYGLMAKFKNLPKLILKKSIQDYCKTIKTSLLKGAVLYQDAQTVDARLTLSSIKSGESDHSLALNHCRVEAFIQKDDIVHGVKVSDSITQETFEVQSKWVVDATGPWKLGPFKRHALITYSKGSHLLIQGNPFELTSAITMFSPKDGRVMFCIPWLTHTLVGTTDTPTDETPDHVSITEDEKQYILDTLNHYFPNAKKGSIKTLSSFAGLRTLIRDPKKSLTELSRNHVINSPTKGLVQVYGGKLTSFVKIGLDVIHFIQRADNKQESKRHLTTFKTIAAVNPTLLSKQHIQNMIDTEYACTISDILIRRTLANLLLEDHGESLISIVQEVLEENFGYSEPEMQKQIFDFKNQSQQWPMLTQTDSNLS